MDPEDVEYIDLDNPETDIKDEIYATKRDVERQIEYIDKGNMCIKTDKGKDYRNTLHNILNVIEEDTFLTNLELPSNNLAVVKERYGENVKRKQRLGVVDSLFPQTHSGGDEKDEFPTIEVSEPDLEISQPKTKILLSSEN